MEFKTLNNEHIDDVIRIDKTISGTDHSDYFHEQFEQQLLVSDNDLMIGAFEKDKIVGFLLASMRQLAFGQAMKVAYLEMIEIDPSLQKSGIGTLLLNEFKKRCNRLSINRVITLVDWQHTLMLNFFKSQGFDKGNMIQLEMSL